MATSPRLRALVLAAGLGTRLRPLTEQVPKPLLPITGRPLIELTLARLVAAGCEAAAINLHHLGGQIRDALGDRFEGMPLTYSEEPELLGTLGALAPLEEFFAAADLVLVVNGDSLCRWPLERLVRRHAKGRARVSLLLTRRASVADYGGGVGVDGDGRVTSFREGGPAAGEAVRRHVFAGAHVFTPDLLAAVDERPSDTVRDLYEPLLAAGSPIRAVISSRRWYDLGTPRRYLDGVLGWLRGMRPWQPGWSSPRAEVDPAARVRRTVVEPGVRVAAGAAVEDALLLPGCEVGAGAVVRRSILGFDTVLPAGARVENRLVVPHRPGRAHDDRDTVVGELLYRRL